MVIGEQLNLQQQPQQQIATTTTGPTTQHQQHQHILRGNSTQNLPDQSATNSAGVSSSKSNSNNNIHCNIGNNINNTNNNTNPISSNNTNTGNGTGGSSLVGGGNNSATATKNQLEQLTTMREALFSQDGWGCQHVNQDTHWEVPNTPPPTDKDSTAGPPLWKPAINNGTDLWESNLRNGGQPSAQPIQKTPWGHTPSSNLGGTWGEDDDGTDSGSVWSGSANNPAAAGNVSVAGVGTPGVAGAHNNGPQWGGQSGVGAGNAATNPAVGVIPSGGANMTTTNVASGTVAGNAGAAAGNNWGDHRELRSGPINNPIDMRSVDPRDPMRAASAGDPRDMRMIDPRDPIRGDPRGISGRLNGTSEMWGAHHPIAHNQIQNMNKMVGGPGVGNAGNVTGAAVSGSGVGIGPAIGAINATSGVSGNVSSQWGAAQNVVGPKDIAAMGGSKPVSGWEEPSPPTQRRAIPNYDDGTSLWSQRVPGGSHWKDIAERSHLIRNSMGGTQNAGNASVVTALGGAGGGAIGNNQPPSMGTPVNVGVNGNQNNVIGGPQGRLATAVGPSPGVGGQHKADNAMGWVHPNNANVVAGRNTSWPDDNGHNVGGPNWVDEKAVVGIGQIGGNVGSGGNSWNDSPANWNKTQTKMAGGSAGWGGTNANDINDLGADWASHGNIVGKPQQKIGGLNSDSVKLTKQYRILVEAGFKKEDVERALLNTNLNLEEAAEMLRTNASISMEGWRRHDETLGSYADHGNPTPTGYPGGRYPAAGSQQALSYPSNNHLLNSMGNAVGNNNPNLPNMASMQTPQVQKYLNQGPHNLPAGPQAVNSPSVGFGQGANVAAAVNVGSNSNMQPSAQQLRMLVQQIQLAVQSGYLSSQILNQPLAPATLVLLNQLLTNIKHLQGAQQSLTRGNNANNLQINVAINKYKQQIQTLQTQINGQQALYVKQHSMQQNPQQHPVNHLNNPNAEYLRGQHDAINALQGNFPEMNLNKTSNYAVATNPQSRLNQWKLPVLEKDVSADSTDFSRAPGAAKQGISVVNTNNMSSLGLQNDGTWSTGRNIGDGWPDPSNEHESKDWSVAQAATTYTDLVQEFEPGKPWKGSQIKNIEDDPSITPGSVARSPLSINPTPKEADLFANTSKNSPTELPPLSLSSNTWSFNPSSNNQNFSSWSDNAQQSEIWGSTAMNKSRGPPPGLGANKSTGNVNNVQNASSVVAGGNSNGWMGRGGVSNSNNSWSGTNSSWNSNWLLLKNLNAQIDGSTLRTLCMQHGPLLNFHLYLNQGIALCKYATREEANKAQMTLNNCVLGNTTICAESPSDNEVQGILQHLPQTPTGVSGGGVGGGGGSGNGGNGPPGGNGGGGNNGNNGSGNGSGVGNNGNSGISNNSVVNGAGNGGNNASSVPGNGANGQAAVNACNNTNSASGVGGVGCNNANTGANVAGGNGNNPAGGNNAAAWRQSQTQQSQARPSGREADFDYLSKFVVSIVDD